MLGSSTEWQLQAILSIDEFYSVSNIGCLSRQLNDSSKLNLVQLLMGEGNKTLIFLITYLIEATSNIFKSMYMTSQQSFNAQPPTEWKLGN